MTESSIEILKSIVGGKGWLSDAQDLEPHLSEWRGTYRGKTPLMLLPSSTDEVAQIVRECARTRTALVAQGGNTGLCGGAIPDKSGDQVLISLSRLKRVRTVSPDDFSLVAEAGCTLTQVQDAALEHDRLFPLSLAAEGSCQIGGNLSTNAGGTNVLRYGTARSQVLGLEVVLPTGEIWDGLRTLRKDTAGYDVKQFFIGAEGTLGIITAASLRLYPVPRHTEVAYVAVESAQAAVELYSALRKPLGDALQAFEYISALAQALVFRHMEGLRPPLDVSAPGFVLIESASQTETEALEGALTDCLEQALLADAVLAKNAAERAEFWRFRHAISEAQKREGASLKHDVSVPVGDVGRFIARAEPAVTKAVPGSRVVAFGHIGDGNVHFNVSQPEEADGQAFLAQRDNVAEAVYDVVAEFGGSISAEHGIGVLKREQLTRYRSEVEVSLMKALKQAIDPHNIMNPGKVL